VLDDDGELDEAKLYRRICDGVSILKGAAKPVVTAAAFFSKGPFWPGSRLRASSVKKRRRRRS
jgi:hypothetical protein